MLLAVHAQRAVEDTLHRVLSIPKHQGNVLVYRAPSPVRSVDKAFGRCASNQTFCSDSLAGLRVTCQNYPFSAAQAVCQDNGMRLALLDDGLAPLANALQRKCMLDPTIGLPAWIGGMNGWAGGPCMHSLVLSVGVFGPLGGLCQNNQTLPASLPALCQEIPVKVIQSTVTSNATASIGTSTVKTTITKSFSSTTITTSSVTSTATRPSKSTAVNCKNELKPVRIPGPWVMMRKMRPCRDSACQSVCPFQAPGFRVISKLVPSSEASQECTSRGWMLADVTTASAAMLFDLIEQCVPSNHPFTWIRSFNGIGGGRCLSVYNSVISGYRLSTPVWSFDADQCSNGVSPVLCQTDDDLDRDAVMTGDGGFNGPLSYTVITPTTLTTTVTTVPVTTVSATRTVCQCNEFGCDPDCWDEVWDEELDRQDDRAFFKNIH